MNQKPRHILYVSHTADLRGSAMSLRELMCNLDTRRFRPHALLSKQGPLLENLEKAGIPVTVVQERGFLNHKRIAQVREYIRRHGIDLLHLNSAVPFCRDAGIAARLESVPVIWHIREDPQGKRVRRWSRWIRWLANRIVVVSSDLEDHFGSSGKAVKIYNGIDLRRFSPAGDDAGWRQRMSIDKDAFVFIVVGTIEERKGQHLAVEALAGLIGQGLSAHLIIVGSALGQSDQARLDAVLDAYPQAAAVTHCVGRQADIAPLLRAADCFILPSTWEGFPRTIAEAMACGLPVISTPVGEIPSMVGSSEGWLIPPCDVGNLLAGMRNALAISDNGQMGTKAASKAQEWSIQEHAEKIQSLYDAVLHCQPSQPGNVK